MVKAQAVSSWRSPLSGRLILKVGRLVCLVRIMAKDFSDAFYHSKAWKDCRKGYSQFVGGLCERCLNNGVFTPGVIVHHKVHLTADNIKDPTIALSWSNLELLCKACHDDEHMDEIKAGTQRHHGRKLRYRIDEFGRVIV